MRTNVVLDDEKVKEAFKISKVKTKKELLNLTLEEYIKSHRAINLKELKGKIEFYEGYDHKKMREGK